MAANCKDRIIWFGTVSYCEFFKYWYCAMMFDNTGSELIKELIVNLPDGLYLSYFGKQKTFADVIVWPNPKPPN